MSFSRILALVVVGLVGAGSVASAQEGSSTVNARPEVHTRVHEQARVTNRMHIRQMNRMHVRLDRMKLKMKPRIHLRTNELKQRLRTGQDRQMRLRVHDRVRMSPMRLRLGSGTAEI